jgi:hypothetical protein
MSDDENNGAQTDQAYIPPMDSEAADDQPAEQPAEEQPRADESDVKESVPVSSHTSTKPVPTDLTTESAWKEISHDSPSINWYLFSVDKKMDLTFKKAGNDGLEGFSKFLQNSPSELLFGLLRVNSNDRGGSKRAKFVYVRFVGGSVNVMQKAKLTPKLGKIGDAFPVKHMTYDLTEDLGNFTIEALAKEMLRVGGAHKPDSYDFGPNQIYVCK